MTSRPVAERLWEKIDQSDADGCWPFNGSRKEQGYGRLLVDGKIALTHRLAWELTFGPIPPDMCVCHRCDNPPCCRPEHLFLGTILDNFRDMDAKGRRARLHGTGNSQARLTPEIAAEIRAATGSQRAIARLFGVSKHTVADIRNGRRWAA